jgi:hypothetical protein
MLGHEHAVGQDGTHDKHAEERGTGVKEIHVRETSKDSTIKGLALGLSPPGQQCQISEGAPRRYTGL